MLLFPSFERDPNEFEFQHPALRLAGWLTFKALHEYSGHFQALDPFLSDLCVRQAEFVRDPYCILDKIHWDFREH